MAERHKLLLELGRGGMGTVYLAVAHGPAGFSKLKVIKHLRAELAADPSFLNMFLDEARLSARLNHPNVVQTNEVGFDGEHYFIEMEFLEGQSYEQLIRQGQAEKGRLPLPVHLWVLSQTLAGLHYAHELTDTDGTPFRVVHRDVSPHNVFVTYEGTVKLLDFGIAKAADSSSDTSTGVIKGKLAYMAPEQAARKPLDRRADIFSVGVMLWQALTGRRLWENFAQAAIFFKLDTGEIERPGAIDPTVPKALDDICMKAMALEPDHRYATAADFQLALEEQMESMGTRVGTRLIAAVMTELFGAKRAQEKGQIDARLKELQAGKQRVDLPVLGHPSVPPPQVSPMSFTGSAELSASATISRVTPSNDKRGGPPVTVPPEASRPTRWRLIIPGLVLAGAIGLGAFILARPNKGPLPPPPSVAKPECTTSADCKSGEVCRARCVPIASEDCKLLGEVDQATILLGTMFPMTGPQATQFGFESVNAADLARHDFATIARGIPDKGTGPARSLALVACDDAADPARAARHLVELRVPAVIGFSSSQEVIDLATSVFIPAGVVAMATQNRSSLITNIPHPPGSPRLVWRTTISSAQSAAPVARIVEDVVERQLRSAGFKEPLKVALVRGSTTAGLSISDALFTHLRFNGKTALENGTLYREFLYGEKDPLDQTIAARVVTDVAAYQPHVIVYVPAGGMGRSILEPVEAAWKNTRYRPRWISNGYLAGDDLLGFIGRNQERRRRFLGVNPPTTTVANAKLTMHYNDRFAPKVTLTQGPGAVYDAVYVVAYASYVADDSSGVALAKAIGRLVPPGAPIDVGPTRIFEAFNTLRGGQNVDLNGAATRLDFDLATGDTPTDFAVLCVGVDEQGKANDAVESGVLYSSRTKTLEGLPLKCP